VLCFTAHARIDDIILEWTKDEHLDAYYLASAAVIFDQCDELG
jgi:hypothetical protein